MDRRPYLITFGTYGARLHGDKRGSWERSHEQVGDGYIPRDDTRRSFEQREMTGPTFVIQPNHRPTIERAIMEVSGKRNWLVLAMNVRTEHVHVVVGADSTPEAVMLAFKSYSTRRLREAGSIPSDSKPWARHGSTRHLIEEGSVEASVDYVLHRQGDVLPGSIFWKEGRTP